MHDALTSHNLHDIDALGIGNECFLIALIIEYSRYRFVLAKYIQKY